MRRLGKRIARRPHAARGAARGENPEHSAFPLVLPICNTICRTQSVTGTAMNLDKFTDRAKASSVRPDRRDPHEPSADRPRASPQGAARGRAGHGFGADPGRGRRRRARAGRNRRGARQGPGGLGRRRAADARGSTTTRCACSTRPSRSRRRPAIPMSPSSGCCSRWCCPGHGGGQGAGRGGREGRGAQRGDQPASPGPRRRHRLRRGPLRRAQEVRARP